MADKKKDTSSSSIQIVCFKIANEEYGIDILKVQEIQKIPKVTKLPKSVDYIQGVIDLRGKVIPIIDLSKKFGIEMPNPDAADRAILIDVDDKKSNVIKRIGIAIENVSHVIRVDDNDIEPPPPVVKGISGKYIVGIAKLKDNFVVILDINQIFSHAEIAQL